MLYMLGLIESLTNYLKITTESNGIEGIISRLNEANGTETKKEKEKKKPLRLSWRHRLQFLGTPREKLRTKSNNLLTKYSNKKWNPLSQGKMDWMYESRIKALQQNWIKRVYTIFRHCLFYLPNKPRLNQREWAEEIDRMRNKWFRFSIK